VVNVYVSGVSLLVPEYAIKKGHTEELYLAVCHDDKDRPKMGGKPVHRHCGQLSNVEMLSPTQ
jgi:hypothetical protein